MVPPSQGQKSAHKCFLSGSEIPREKALNATSCLRFISPTRAARSIFCEVLLSTVCLCLLSLSPSGAADSVYPLQMSCLESRR